MNTTKKQTPKPSAPADKSARVKSEEPGEYRARPELSYDGRGINGPDEYRSRIATFTSDTAGDQYGKLFAAAPAMLAACKGAQSALRKALPFLPADREAIYAGEWLDEITAVIASAGELQA